MPDMLIRNVPEKVQGVLRQRAKGAGMSVQSYVVKLLEEHTERMTMREWLDMVRPHRTLAGSVGADAVRESREEDDRLWDEHLRERYPHRFK